MPYKVPHNRTKDVQRLSQTLRVKQQQLSRLEADNEQLSHRHCLLSATCDILRLLATLKNASNGTQSANGASQQPVTTAEAELLQHLRSLQSQDSSLLNASHSYGAVNPILQHSISLSSNDSSHSNTNGPPEVLSLLHLEETETLCTFEDPIRTLRLALTREDADPYPSIESMTIEQMQAEYQGIIHQVALNLGFMDNPFFRSRTDEQNPFAVIKHTVSSHSRLLTALLLRGRGYMIPLFMMTNVVTGELIEEQDPAVYDHAAQCLGLTVAQQKRIQETLSLYRSLLGGVLEKRQNVQLILALNGGADMSSLLSSSNGNSSHSPPASQAASQASNAEACSNTASISCNNGPSGSADASLKRTLSQQQQQVLEAREQQQQNITDVVKLLQKESLLKACCWASIEGCLTWPQLAKFLITCYPHRASPVALAQAIERLMFGAKDPNEQQGSGI